MTKAILAIALAAVVLGGCSKSSDSGTTSDASSPAADATAAAAADAAASPAADAAASSAASTSAPDAGAAPASGASAAPAGGEAAVDLPVYPGATEEGDKGLQMSTGTASVKMQIFQTKTDSKTVIDWYKSHLPSSWQNFVISNDGKTVGTFASQSSGSKPAAVDQSVIVTSENGVTRIQLTTKKGS